ncbi:hypothetical protein [Vibrio sp. DNB22_19_2]
MKFSSYYGRRHVATSKLTALVLFLISVVSLPTVLMGCQDEDTQAINYSVTHTFSVDDIIGQFNGSTYAQNPAILCGITTESPDCNNTQPLIEKKSGQILYPIDSEFGYVIEDFVGAASKVLDGDYAEGWANNINLLPNGAGLMVANAPTGVFKAPKLLGTWCSGLGGSLVKCSTEHYTTMEHILTCYESIPYATTDFLNLRLLDPLSGEQRSLVDPNPELVGPNKIIGSCSDERLDDELFIVRDGVVTTEQLTSNDPTEGQMAANESSVRQDLALGKDYSVSLKDDGKVLYRWGNAVKRPNDIRLYARMALPNAWKVPGANYEVIKAELVVIHEITNNPNDQLRPEDMENEAATGRLPSYSVVGENWVSTRDCYEGDGDFIPAGTLFKNSAFANSNGFSADLTKGLTNAWYTTIDRDPFDSGTNVGPRWRLKSNKFGQDVPSLEIPFASCTPPPYNHDSYKYVVGTETRTTINLLDYRDGEESPLSTSEGWVDASKNSVNIGASNRTDEGNGTSINGLPLTEDFDLAVYIKGDAKGTRIYNATLNIDYSPVNLGGDSDEGL